MRVDGGLNLPLSYLAWLLRKARGGRVVSWGCRWLSGILGLQVGVLGLQVALFPVHFSSLTQQEPQYSVGTGRGSSHFSSLDWVKRTHPILCPVTPES